MRDGGLRVLGGLCVVLCAVACAGPARVAEDDAAYAVAANDPYHDGAKETSPHDPFSNRVLQGEADGLAVSGAHVSGAHVSGAHVSGAHVSGAHVSGARLPGDEAFSDRAPWYDDAEAGSTSGIETDPFAKASAEYAENLSVAADLADCILPSVGTPLLGPSRFVSVDDILSRLGDEDFVLLDVRSRASYEEGHLPGAAHLAASNFLAEESEGMPAGFFRDDTGALDLARYETMLGDAGIESQHHVCIYGNLSASSDDAMTAVPAAILDILGHESVTVLPGVAVDCWRMAGFETTQVSHGLPRATYAAQARDGAVWNLDLLFTSLVSRDVVLVDVRSPDAYDGADIGGNRYGGRIPGAVNFEAIGLFDDEDTLDVRHRDELLVKLAALSVTGSARRVVYGHDASWASLVYFVLRDLGYEDVSIYDKGWAEYGNRDDTPIDERSLPPLRN